MMEVGWQARLGIKIMCSSKLADGCCLRGEESADGVGKWLLEVRFKLGVAWCLMCQ